MRPVLACLVLMLAGCASTPHVVTLPSVCPAPRDEPIDLMQPLAPELPELGEGLSPREAAKRLMVVRAESRGMYAACIVSRSGLIDWIRGD